MQARCIVFKSVGVGGGTELPDSPNKQNKNRYQTTYSNRLFRHFAAAFLKAETHMLEEYSHKCINCYMKQ